MSQYTTCRECGADLGANGRTFGTNECCCDKGICISCCDEGDEVTA